MPWLFADENDGDVDIKINVPDGVVSAFSKNDPTKPKWEYRVSMWTCYGCVVVL